MASNRSVQEPCGCCGWLQLHNPKWSTRMVAARRDVVSSFPYPSKHMNMGACVSLIYEGPAPSRNHRASLQVVGAQRSLIHHHSALRRAPETHASAAPLLGGGSRLLGEHSFGLGVGGAFWLVLDLGVLLVESLQGKPQGNHCSMSGRRSKNPQLGLCKSSAGPSFGFPSLG